MTACATETTVKDGRTARHSTFTIAADGAYAARLNASAEGGWFPERWTLDGPEPYAVPLPGARPEDVGSQVLPLADGRVLIARLEAGSHQLALLYPTGPSTGELRLGAVESERLTLLPPAPCGRRAYALTHGEHSTGVWLVAGGSEGPQLVAEVSGHCSGGAWLDREGRLLAVDRTDTGGTGRTKSVVIDFARQGEVTPLLQITDESDDRLLLADADSGLLIVRSNAPGEMRLGWGVLGSHRPIRFPESLHPDNALLTPFAVQPGQMLIPESCAVALHGQTTGARAGGAWLGVWRPMQKELRRFRAPGGWLPGKGVWTREGELRLPCASAHAPCGLARLRMRGREHGEEPTGGAVTNPPGMRPALGPGTSADGGESAGAAAGPEAAPALRGKSEPAPERRPLPPEVTPAAPAVDNPTPPAGSPAVRTVEEGAPARGTPVGEPARVAPVAEPARVAPVAEPLPKEAPTVQGLTVHGLTVQGRPVRRRLGEGLSKGTPKPPPDPAPEGAPAAASDDSPDGGPRKPVPLQDAPLQTALHADVVRTQTA